MTPANHCPRTSALLQGCLDPEPAANQTDMEQHLSTCPVCAHAVSEHRASHQMLRTRLRSSVLSTPAPLGLETRVRQTLDEASSRTASRRFSGWPAMAFALSALIAFGVALRWHNGGLRFTPGAQDSYIAAIAPEVAPVMRIGLQQHVHCAVFQKLPSQWPTLEEMANELGPKYADLAPALSSHLPPGFRIATAHLCEYRGRYYTHLAATDGSRLISLLITVRDPREAFEGELRAVSTEAGVPLYAAGVQRFRIAGFQTRDHLVYLVSDLPAAENLATLRSLQPGVDQALRRLEI